MKIVLKLFILGHTTVGAKATKNLQSLVEENIKVPVDIEIIDLLENPEWAMTYRILATPTLIKFSPKPEQRVIGDLIDKKKVLYGLGLSEYRRDAIPGQGEGQ